MIKIGLLGLGTVGSGVYEILTSKKNKIEKHIDRNIEINKVLVSNLNKDRDVQVNKDLLTDNPNDILENPEIDMIVEVIGDKENAYKYMKKALENGKHVVTANKAVLSEHLYELNNISTKNRKALMFEASVAGGIPIIKNLSEMLNLNNITKIKGILNGTTNFILSKMAEDKIEFDQALKLAQNLGYAEADPTDDIQGYDAARKIAILSSIAFGNTLNLDDVECQGVTLISAFDIIFLKKLGFEVKLISSATVLENDLSIEVVPVLIDKNSIMASVNDANNIVLLTGDIIGELKFYGQGAGKNPTANAVVSDILDIIKQKYKHLDLEDKENNLNIVNTCSDYYFRIYLKDEREKNNILNKIQKYGIKYNIIEEKENLICLLQETNMKDIKEMVAYLNISNRFSYIKIDDSNKVKFNI